MEIKYKYKDKKAEVKSYLDNIISNWVSRSYSKTNDDYAEQIDQLYNTREVESIQLGDINIALERYIDTKEHYVHIETNQGDYDMEYEKFSKFVEALNNIKTQME